MMSEQNTQFDPLNEQPNEGLTTQDIVSASRRKDAEPADAAALRESLNKRDASVYAREAGVEPGGPGIAPTRAAGQHGWIDTPHATPMPLMSDAAADAFQARWDAIQTAFVDEPRQVVEQADSLVAEVMQHLTETFAQERASLERQWERGGDVSTEDLRLVLQRYRSFFQRLLLA